MVFTARLMIQTYSTTAILWNYCHSEGQAPQTQRPEGKRGMQMSQPSFHGAISSSRQHTSNIGPVDSRTWSKRAGRDKTEEQHEHDCSTEPQKDYALDKTCSRLKAEFLKGTPKTLSLKEALELFRPDFISRSQGRVRRLEQRALRRRELQDSNPDLVQGLREDRFKQKRNCTTPDPLSDNLFKPRERSISGREMQLRSRRIYNKLPEVTKKKEEEKKRAVSETNRLRAEVFKKRLLDQILQR
ncbi:Centrosomal protein C10orf90-like protein [Larimichthys crocea]|uniref:Uncharacterized protein n=1 Tax=Larimichthys crocea TaxID=215358 RepID=A0ACD3QCE2_LARCR|nr:Centrosomal protein C10orf90-like protein [Larimichthys crocea]